MKDWNFDKWFCAVLLTLMIIMSVLWIAREIAKPSDEKKCTAIAEKMNIHHFYSLETGCMIKIDGFWYPLNSYRKI